MDAVRVHLIEPAVDILPLGVGQRRPEHIRGKAERQIQRGSLDHLLVIIEDVPPVFGMAWVGAMDKTRTVEVGPCRDFCLLISGQGGIIAAEQGAKPPEDTRPALHAGILFAIVGGGVANLEQSAPRRVKRFERTNQIQQRRDGVLPGLHRVGG